MEIEQILKEIELNTEGKLAREAIEAARQQREAITPRLLQVIRTVADDLEGVIVDKYVAHIYAMYLLAEFREPKACAEIIRFFNQPEKSHLPVDLTGDVVTEDLGRILACVCGDGISPIKAIIEDPAFDDYVRGAAIDALITLVARGRLAREELIGYFRHLFHTLEREPGTMWDAVVSGSLDIHAMALLPEIAAAYKDGLVWELMVNEEDVCWTCREGEERALERLAANRHYTLIDDTVSELEHWACFNPPPPAFTNRRKLKPGSQWLADYHPPVKAEPVKAKPKVGRNDPCPCGSGRKFKKCCGG